MQDIGQVYLESRVLGSYSSHSIRPSKALREPNPVHWLRVTTTSYNKKPPEGGLLSAQSWRIGQDWPKP